LLIYPAWRASVYTSSLVILAGIWVLMGFGRWRQAHNFQEWEKSRGLLLKITALAWTSRVGILAVVALI
jgi:hypothetical protein